MLIRCAIFLAMVRHSHWTSALRAFHGERFSGLPSAENQKKSGCVGSPARTRLRVSWPDNRDFSRFWPTFLALRWKKSPFSAGYFIQFPKPGTGNFSGANRDLSRPNRDECHPNREARIKSGRRQKATNKLILQSKFIYSA